MASMDQATDLTGCFLIAMPGLTGEPFERSVCYICQYDQQGALGLVLNKPHDMQLSEIFEQTEMTASSEQVAALPVFRGGPVNTERCLVIHQPLGEWSATLQVSDQIGVTGSSDVLEAIADGRGPHRFQVCLGYAGWGANQLDKEILDNSWLVAPADMEVMFDLPLEQRWRSALARMGIDPNRLSSDVGHA